MKTKAKQPSRSPPKHWKFFVLFGAHVGLLLSVGPAKVLGVFLVRFKEEFDSNSGVMGLITTLTLFFLSIAGLGASMLCKRYSCRIVTMAGGLVIGLGLILTSFARNIFQLILFIDVLTGVGIGLTGNPCLVVIAYYFDKNYATANGVAMAGVDLGIVLLPPLADYLSELYGWRGALLILGAISMNVTAMGSLFRPNPRIKEGISDRAGRIEEYDDANPGESVIMLENHETVRNMKVGGISDSAVTELTDSQTVPKSQAKLLNETEGYQNTDSSSAHESFVFSASEVNNEGGPSNSDDTVSRMHVSVIKKFFNSMDLSLFLLPKYLMFMPVTLIVGMANAGVLAHIVARGVSEGIAPFSAAFLLSGIGLTSMVARATHGIIIDKGLLSAVRLYTVALTLGSVFTFLSLFCKSFPSFLIYSLCYGCVCGIFQSASIPIAKSVVPSSRLSGAVAWLFIFRGIGGFLGGLIPGLLFDATGDYDRSFQVIAGCFLLAAILMAAFSYGKGHKKRRESKTLSPVELHLQECVSI
ncbi:monocarboxylate transporter 13-like [Anneissia japonica]|uniref:monocarboxylate transporter 13-like n=1 Tax=Anneissia japonica TaxID=1529436 RepID=UPI0014259479|nr:monocarboxylate transporter 13-like [Anneissia japonica]